METLYLEKSETKKAAEILSQGGLVAIPTETVYGLAADAFNEKAIKNIFIAKGRPSDNPLIVHISKLNDIYKVVSDFNLKAQKLAKAFWPGPLTMILHKNENIPLVVTANMQTVAVRFPSNTIAREIIDFLGEPLVAPSANLSGKPSPTKASHVLEDLNGKIDAIVDGGDCDFGLESTVVSLVGETALILRPGAITPNQIENVLGSVKIDDCVFSKIKSNQKVLSPGMKYKHYAPKAKVYLVNSNCEKYCEFINNKKDENILALCFDEDVNFIKTKFISYGSQSDFLNQAKNLFSCLRQADKLNPSTIYTHITNPQGVGLAVYNRLIRSAGFDIIDL